MKKFAALERVQQRPQAEAEPAGMDADAQLNDGGEQTLTEEQLLEVFKQTSTFTVRGATANGEKCLRPRCFSLLEL